MDTRKVKFKNNLTSKLITALLLIAPGLKAQHVEVLQQAKQTSIRGLSVVDDNVAWISGSRGNIAITADGGKTWSWQQVKGYERLDFRDIEAFSDKEAVIMSSGTPAVILKTTDAGTNWNVCYTNTDKAYFLDAMDFETPKHGFIMGDPINGKFLLLETKDGGTTWTPANGPDAIPNQAAFAAGGTCFRTGSLFAIVSGGSVAELITPKTKDSWTHSRVPVLQGKSAQGAFSVAAGGKKIIVVGGDYEKDKREDSTACYSTDKGKTWHLADKFPEGFQSAVEFIKGDTFIATGTPGTNLTTDGGKTWVKIDATSYNAVRKAKRGSMILLAGNGKIGIFKP